MRGINVEGSKHTVHAVSPDGEAEKRPAEPLEVEYQVKKSGALDEAVLEQRKTCIGRWKHPTRREGIQVLAMSILTTLVIFSLLVVSAYEHNSPATLTLVIVLFVDTVVASMILSRLTCCYDAERTGSLVYKSVIIDCIVSALFIGLSLSVMVHAIHNLIERRYVSNTRLLIGTLIPTFVALLVLGLIKLMIAKTSELGSMKATSVISLVGAKMAMGVFLSTLFVHQDPTAWWVDSVFAIIISVSLLIYGSVTIYSIFKGGSGGFPSPQGRIGDPADGLTESEQIEI